MPEQVPDHDRLKEKKTVKCEQLGAGEILLTSMDEDGQKRPYQGLLDSYADKKDRVG